ncbi:MAG: VWA domain-containing protein [Akkermansiaceae bacterium]|nr:VWA domain-containing protein [Akkermansiaceae bacterium]
MKLDHPYVLFLLLVVPLLGATALIAAHLRRKQWSEFVAPRLRPVLLKSAGPLARWVALALMLAAVASLVIALSRPQATAGTRTEKTLGRNVMIALDLSRSMRVPDIKPDRLSQAKVIIYELLESMPNERFGLIGFAGSSYVYAPLTIDRVAVRETAEQIDENWVTVGGSNLSSAVELAIETLRKTGQRNNALVLISDGEQHDGRLASLASEAEQAGVYVVAIGVGTPDGGFVPDPNAPGQQMADQEGRPVLSRLHDEGLRELAKETGGRFALAGSGTDVTSIVKSVVGDLDAFEVESRERKVVVEFYQWFTLPAILFLMAALFIGTRWRGIAPRPAAALLAIAFLTGTASSRADQVSSARSALRDQNYSSAQAEYHKLAEKARLDGRRALYQFGEGEAAYRARNFRDAREAYSGALRSKDDVVAAKGHVGMGNTLFQLGWSGLTQKSYPSPGTGGFDLERFDELVRGLLTKDPAKEEVDIAATIKPLVTNWTDAVRHYESALALDSSNPTASHNRDLTMVYLKRLKELLKEESDETAQQMPQPGEGEPQESEQEGEGGEDGETGKGGKNDDEKEPKDGGDEPKDSKPKDDGKKPDQDNEGESDKGPKDPNETPEDRARRILKDNADLEKGPLTPGRREFRPPDKDW